MPEIALTARLRTSLVDVVIERSPTSARLLDGSAHYTAGFSHLVLGNRVQSRPSETIYIIASMLLTECTREKIAEKMARIGRRPRLKRERQNPLHEPFNKVCFSMAHAGVNP